MTTPSNDTPSGAPPPADDLIDLPSLARAIWGPVLDLAPPEPRPDAFTGTGLTTNGLNPILGAAYAAKGYTPGGAGLGADATSVAPAPTDLSDLQPPLPGLTAAGAQPVVAAPLVDGSPLQPIDPLGGVTRLVAGAGGRGNEGVGGPVTPSAGDQPEPRGANAPSVLDGDGRSAFDRDLNDAVNDGSTGRFTPIMNGAGGSVAPLTGVTPRLPYNQWLKGLIASGGHGVNNSGHPTSIDIKDNPAANGSAPIYEIPAFSQVGNYNDAISRNAKKWGVDPDLMRSIMYVETTHGYYSPIAEALGINGSFPPMKVNTNMWGNTFGTRDQLTDPEINIFEASRLLSYIKTALGSNYTVAKAATLYNDLSAGSVTNYGARVASVYQAKPWLPAPKGPNVHGSGAGISH